MKKFCDNCYAVTITFIAIIILIVGIVVIQRSCSGNGEEDKNILSTTYQNSSTTQIGSTIISFDDNNIEIGSAITHNEGSNVININEDGVYQVSYQLFGTRETVGTFNFSAVILINGEALEQTLKEGPILLDQVVNRMTLTGIVFLELQAGDELQLGAVSVENIRYPRARIDIEKIE